MLETQAQSSFKIQADIRPRFEYRHGFNDLFPNDASASAFVRQRSRLNVGYDRMLNDTKLKLFVAVQDVSTWGDTRQIFPQDGNDSFSLFQAWTEISFNKVAIKLGRQVVSYDDQRIFGGLDWAMQGRFHDLALVKFDKEGREFHIGFAINSSGEPREDIIYPHSAQLYSYKYMQYIRYSRQFEKAKLSLLFLNNSYQSTKVDSSGEEAPDGTYDRQTLGAFYKQPISKFVLDASFYYQMGDISQSKTLSGAYQFSANLGYKPRKTLFAIGAELLSGTSQQNITSNDNNSFFPLFGTNHKFNGFMDYFYVGNHANNVGLNDFNAKVVMPVGKAKLLVKGHYFLSNAKLANDKSSILGTEIDIVFSKKIADDISLTAGLSYLSPTESMGIIKGKPHNNDNYWGFASLKINPTLFVYEKE